MKNVLILGDNRTNLISPIIEELSKREFHVDYIDASELDRQKKYPSFFHKIVAKCFYNITLKGKRHWGREKYIRENSVDRYDHVLVFIPAMLNSKIADELKEKTEHLVCILWDSLNKVPAGDVLLDVADNIYSFDRQDCKNSKINYLASYHLDTLNYEASDQVDFFGIFSISGKNDSRYGEILKFIKSNKSLSGEVVFVSRKLDEERFNINSTDIVIRKEKLIGKELNKKLKRSKCILDVVDPRQSGLSFRLSDAYRYRKLLITNNQAIKKEQWFEDNFFLIGENGDYTLDSVFFNKGYTSVKTPYSIESWVEKLLYK